MTEVIALFAQRSDAEGAIDALESMGFNADTMGYLDGRHRAEDMIDGDVAPDFERDRHGDAGDEAVKGAAGGAAGGAAVGAGAGLLAATGVALIPGIGPFLAAGTLIGTLGAAAAGAAGGAVVGGAAGAIFGAATDDDEYGTYYREGVQEGGSLVTVQADRDSVERIRSTLRDHGAKRVDVYGDDGWIA
ncbi:MAG TPA: hypothetical protein VLB67_11415 [Acidimicrobiia bacterium]|nr:hypothetical protein [Acidimicrobiia bacterium]